MKLYQHSSSSNRDDEISSSVSCSCHHIVTSVTSNSVTTKLVIASLIALLFMIAEIIGICVYKILAIMTDAAHMLSDLAGFLISLFAIWVGSRPPSKRMSFRWHVRVIGY
ncbi:proton-coupled zinc antiporter SLC30A2-like [Halichondria panicea]|uniref:proton-coupled zinc antiporter SLC30A2-like n=1 Tax=Halichondria panicea TaxID=6063 RepID=UPI00312B6C6C